MAKPYIHAMNSANKFGGVWTDYIKIHELMDSSKSVIADNRHRTLTHNSWFISVILPAIFGEVFQRESDGRNVSTRDIGEQHVGEDFGNRFIPSAQDYLQVMELEIWMNSGKGHPSSANKLREHKEYKHD